MKCYDFLIEKLALKENYTKIIFDKFKIINDEFFSNYLNAKNINFAIAKNIDEIFSLIKNNKNIFIVKEFEIPAYLKDKYPTIELNEKFLPFKFSSEVIKKLSQSEIKKIIFFYFETLKYNYINQNNIEKVKLEANNFYIKVKNQELIKKIDNFLAICNSYENLIEISKFYGEFLYNCYLANEKIDENIIKKIDEKTFDLILNSSLYQDSFYSSLMNFKTVNRVTSYIKNLNLDKFAFIVFDGMGVAEWFLLKKFLKDNCCKINEKFIFALIPTTTSISRAALFSGKIEECFIEKINEDKEFRNIFKKHFIKNFKENDIITEDQLHGVEIVKVIYNFFDKIAHSTILPLQNSNKFFYYKTLENYLKNTDILRNIKFLLNNGFKIFICSDHGCVVSHGNGIKIDKYLIEENCKRAAIVEDSNLIAKYENDVYIFNPPFVNNKKVLIAKDRESFTYKNKVEISHGGITFEEIIIPFVEVYK